MKKILIIGASILQLPAIKKAKELNYYVGVVDYDPKAIGIALADEYFNVSTIDIEGVVDCAKHFLPDGIMTLATDMPMRSIAAACKELNLIGISSETALKATDKGLMIRAFEEYNVAHPWYYILSGNEPIDKVINKISYPCIVKPTDNSGSRGVVLVDSPDELFEAVLYSRSNGRTGDVIFEEYLTGNEVSVEVMVINNVPHVLQVTDKLTTGAPHFVELGHSEPSSLESGVLEAVSVLAQDACKAIGINNGPAHVEIIVTEDGPKMVELGARMGGDNITTHLVPLSTGIDMVAATIHNSCGEPIDIQPKHCRGSAIRFITAKKGVVKGIEGIENAMKTPGIKEVKVNISVGDNIEDLTNSTDRVGYVIAEAESSDLALAACEKALSEIHIII